MSEKLQNALNEQITAELWSANLYLSTSHAGGKLRQSVSVSYGFSFRQL